MEKKLVRKMSARFMPMVCALFFIQFIDKSILTAVGIIPRFYTDTKINHDQYGWLGSIFSLGYLCMQIPNNYLMQKLPISKYLGTVLFSWGIVLFCMALSHNFAQLAALRFLLGFFEAVSYPCIFLLIATMYRRSEQVIFIGLSYVSNSVAIVLGSLISLGILHMPTRGEWSAWKFYFVIFGSITIIMGVIYFFLLPDNPKSRWFKLTEEEVAIVDERTRDNAVVRNKRFEISHVWEAIRELRLYLYCLISICINLQNGGINLFANIIITEMGFSNVNAILLHLPGGVILILMILLTIYLSKRLKDICYIAIGATVVSLVGLICLVAIPAGGSKLVGLYLSGAGTPVYVLMQTSISNNVSGYTKKIFYTSCAIIFSTFGNFTGPLLLRSQDEPRYIMGLSVYAAANAVVVICFILIRFSYARENKRRMLNKAADAVALPDDFKDLTDKQNQHFIYRT
ncbi:major facilitator superfamily domain-containing protein [Mycotypha africana]|uniref:major facilitator superfamily domain-containing protein n=1 Tax=Mycotypha africana TaxID=64632 RepID=UPI002301C274|nr:major facilitator superfamily domain-containing protein [Mycotypha africana]KAI8969162.1 major facilitator superfamily domain-containing protein [Mycotypha africana]